jgi:CRP-like cAMP-binding protein
MSTQIVLEALRALDFTKDFEAKKIEKLAGISTYVTFSEGAMIFREGDSSELVYLIIEGGVDLLTQVPGHGQVEILQLEPGQLLGWSSLFPPQKKTASARTNKPTKAVAVNALKLLDLCEEDTDFGYRIVWKIADIISGRLRAARAQLLDMFEPEKQL